MADQAALETRITIRIRLLRLESLRYESTQPGSLDPGCARNYQLSTPTTAEAAVSDVVAVSGSLAVG